MSAPSARGRRLTHSDKQRTSLQQTQHKKTTTTRGSDALKCCLALAGCQAAMMQSVMHIMGSFLSDLIPPLSISSSSLALQPVVPLFFQLPLFIYLPCSSVFLTISSPFTFSSSSKTLICAHPSILSPPSPLICHVAD